MIAIILLYAGLLHIHLQRSVQQEDRGEEGEILGEVDASRPRPFDGSRRDT